MNNTKSLSILALLFGALFLSIGGVFIRVSELEPTASAIYRVLFSSPLFFLIYFLSPSKNEPISRKDISSFILLGLIFSGNLSTYHWAVEYSTLANSSLLANTAPIFVILLSFLLLRKRYNPKLLLSMSISFIGVFFILKEGLIFSETLTKGNYLGILSGFFYGLYFFTLSLIRKEHNIFLIMGISSIGTAIMLLFISVHLDENLIPSSMHGWFILFLLAFFSHFMGQGLIAYAMGNLSLSFSSLTLLIQVFFSYILGVAIYSEQLSYWSLTGIFMVLFGIILSKRYS